MNKTIDFENKYCAQNYAPLPVVLTHGKGVHVWDENGKQYLDMMSAYSAVSHGHCHPRLLKVLNEQASKLAIVSRAYYTDQLGPFLQKACELTELPKALPMNSGAEAVETAIKAARKWGYQKKRVAEGKAKIITCKNNFHGRTITIVGMSSEPQYKEGFGPYAPGFVNIPFGDVDALEKEIDENTVAFLVEPIQGEGGIVLPPKGYLKACEALCKKHNVLLICDEIQTGLARTGKFLACWHDDVKPDGLILGKALGGGLLPVSLFLAKEEVMEVFTPGDHGSTFGGNALSSAVAKEALDIMIEDDYCKRSEELGAYMLAELNKIQAPAIRQIRGQGLYIGLEINTNLVSAREVCLKLLEKGLLSKDTHHVVIRLAPPLIIEKKEIDQAVEMIKSVLIS